MAGLTREEIEQYRNRPGVFSGSVEVELCDMALRLIDHEENPPAYGMLIKRDRETFEHIGALRQQIEVETAAQHRLFERARAAEHDLARHIEIASQEAERAEKAEAEAASLRETRQQEVRATEQWKERARLAESRVNHLLDKLEAREALHPTDTHVSPARGEGDRSGPCPTCNDEGGVTPEGPNGEQYWRACPDCATDPAPADRPEPSELPADCEADAMRCAGGTECRWEKAKRDSQEDRPEPSALDRDAVLNMLGQLTYGDPSGQTHIRNIPQIRQYILSQPAPAVPEEVAKLANRCLWIAFAWNDHNFDGNPEEYAREEAKRLGIHDGEGAQQFMARVFAAAPTPAGNGEDQGHE